MATIPESGCQRWIQHLWGMISAAFFLLVLVVLGSFLGRLWWPCDLASSFRLQYLWAALLALGIFALGRRWRQAVVALFLSVGLSLNLMPMYQGSVSLDSSAPTCRLLLMNVRTSNTAHERVVELVRKEDPDVVLLEEVNAAWLEDLEELRQHYPHHVEVPEEDNFGIAIYTRLPVRNLKMIQLGEAQLASVHAEVDLDGRIFHILGTHPLPPGGKDYWAWRNDHLNELAVYRRTCDGPLVILGDLNVTPWSPFFGDLLEKAGLKDARQGFGLQTTWPTFLPFLRIPIDHCLVSPDFQVQDFRRGEAVGSDHFPLHVTLQWSSP